MKKTVLDMIDGLPLYFYPMVTAVIFILAMSR